MPDEPWLQCTCVALYYKYIQILHASCPTDVGIPRNVCVYTSVFLGLRCHGVIPLPYTEAATLSIMYPITIQSPSLDHKNCVAIVFASCCKMLQLCIQYCSLLLSFPHHAASYPHSWWGGRPASPAELDTTKIKLRATYRAPPFKMQCFFQNS